MLTAKPVFVTRTTFPFWLVPMKRKLVFAAKKAVAVVPPVSEVRLTVF